MTAGAGQMHPVLDNRVDPEDTPRFVDLILTGGNIISAASINLKPSGDNDDYLSFSTVSNIPTTTIIGGVVWHITAETEGVALELFEDPDNRTFFGWDGTDTGIIGSTHNIRLHSLGNNGNITLTPHGTGEVNIDSDLDITPEGAKIKLTNNSQTLSISASASMSSSDDYTWPATDAASDRQPIVSNASAVLRFGDTYYSQTEIGATSDPTGASLVGITAGVGSPTVTSVQAKFDNVGSSGYFTGGELTDGGAGTIDVAAGEGFIRATADDNAPLVSFKWSASAGIAVTDNTTQYVFVDDTGTINLNSDEFFESVDNIMLGVVTDEAGAISHTFNLGVRLQESIGQMGRYIRHVDSVVRNRRKGGLVFGESEDVNRYVTISPGQLEWGRTSYPIPAFNTSGADTFDTYSAGGQEATGVSSWPNDSYDNAGTLTALGNKKWAVLWWYIEPDGHVVMLYGRAQYNTEGQAEDEGEPADSIPPRLAAASVISSKFIFQEGEDIAAKIETAFGTPFTGSGVTAHNNLATLSWTSAGHTGTASTIASFDSAGASHESGVLIDDSDNVSGIGTLGCSTLTVVAPNPSAITREAVSSVGVQRALFVRRDTGATSLVAGDGVGIVLDIFASGTEPVQTARNLASFDGFVEGVQSNRDGRAELSTSDGGTLKPFLSANCIQEVTIHGDLVSIAGVGSITASGDDMVIDVSVGNLKLAGVGPVVVEGSLSVTNVTSTDDLTVRDDATIEGELKGGRMIVGYGFPLGVTGGSTQVLRVMNPVITGILGYVMTRNGSVVGISGIVDINADPEGAETVSFEIRTDGDTTLNTEIFNPNGVGDGQTFSNTYARDTYTFFAGEVLQIRMAPDAGINTDDVTVSLEIQYDT